MIKVKRSYGNDPAAKGSEENYNLYGKEKAGWVCPTYDQSKLIRLDPHVVAENKGIAILPGSPDIEAYKVLRTKIMKLTKEKGWNTVMVTSALPGDGKTLTTINLSLTFAREFNHTVLLVDCDLRKQNVHEVLGIDSKKGLIDYLLNDVPIPEIMIWPGVEKFTLISGGRTVHDSAELLASPKMKTLFEEMKKRYADRYIFFDVPPLLSVSDAMTFATLVDCILFVVEAGKTSMADVERAVEMIPREKFLGFVVNRKKEHLSDYDARSYYGYPLKHTI